MNPFSSAKRNDLLLFALLVPIIFYGAIFQGGYYPRHFHAIYVGTFLLLALWLCGRLFSKENHFSPSQELLLTFSLSSFYVLCALQLVLFLAGAGEGLTTANPYMTYKALPVVLCHILLFFFFCDAFRSSRIVYGYFNCLFLLTSALALLGLLQDIIPNIWRKNMFFTRTIYADFFGTFFNNDHFAFLLNLILPFAAVTTFWEVMTHYSWKRPLAALLHITRRPLAIKILGVFILMVTTGWTGSRSGAVAIGVALSVTVLLLLLVTWRKAPDKLPLLLSILVLSALAVPLLLFFTGVPNALKQIYWWYCRIFAIVSDPQLDPSYAGRLLVVRDSLPAILQHPLFGSGLGSFKTIFRVYETFTLGGAVWANAHNDYLELLLETGIAGFALLILVPFGIMLKRLWRSVREWDEVPSGHLILLIGSVGGLVAAGVHSWTDFSLKLPTTMMIWASLAAVPFSLLPRNEAKPRTTLGILTTLSLTAFVVVHGMMFELPFRAEARMKKGGYGALDRAVQLDPLNADHRVELFRRLMSQRDWSQEEKAAAEIIKISPTAQNYHAIGERLLVEGVRRPEYLSRAVPYLEKAAALAPMEDRYLTDLITSQIRLAERAETESKEWLPHLEAIDRILRRRVLLEKGLSPALKEKISKIMGDVQSRPLQKRLLDLLADGSKPAPVA